MTVELKKQLLLVREFLVSPHYDIFKRLLMKLISVISQDARYNRNQVQAMNGGAKKSLNYSRVEF